MMQASYWSFVVFVVAMVATPGPANLTLMAIGASRGAAAAVPLMSGAIVGSTLLNLSVGFGLGQIMSQGGMLVDIMKVACAGYMVYLAWKVWRMSLSAATAQERFTFVEGFMIHPLSPKAWAMSVVGFTHFFDAGGDLVSQVGIFTTTFLTAVIIFHSSWALAGAGILRVLGQGNRMKIVNGCMAVSMVVITIWAMYL